MPTRIITSTHTIRFAVTFYNVLVNSRRIITSNLLIRKGPPFTTVMTGRLPMPGCAPYYGCTVTPAEEG